MPRPPPVTTTVLPSDIQDDVNIENFKTLCIFLTKLTVVRQSSGPLVSVLLEHVHGADKVHVELEEDCLHHRLDEVPHLSEIETQSHLSCQSYVSHLDEFYNNMHSV